MESMARIEESYCFDTDEFISQSIEDKCKHTLGSIIRENPLIYDKGATLTKIECDH